jgi:hypothetical protein
MAEKDGITSDMRSREDDYFRRKDRELVELMRKAAADQQARQELEARSGIHDSAMLQELEALGFTPETVSLLPLVPIVQVAWAEGGISEDERRLIIQFARQRGIAPGSEPDQKLAEWLKTQPSEVVFSRATRLIRAMLDDQSSGQQELKIDDLIRRCEEIAAASGGVLGFRKISADERALLGQIESALKAR